MTKLNDLQGKRFGKLTVTHREAHSRNGWVRWHCICDCGGETSVLAGHLSKGSTKSCGCLNKIVGPAHPLWSGYKDISGHHYKLLQHASSGKTRKAILFEVSIEYLGDLFEEQGARCAITNIPIVALSTDRARTASLDRIDNTLGYIEGNVQWVHKHINMMKGKLDQEYFVLLCKSVTDNNLDTTDMCLVKAE